MSYEQKVDEEEFDIHALPWWGYVIIGAVFVVIVYLVMR